MNTQAQVEVKIEMLPDQVSFRVSFLPSITWAFPDNLTSTAQITLRVPHGGFQISNFQSVAGTWANNARVDAPAENPNFDYLVFGLTTASDAITYQTGEETLLFTFKNTGVCTGAVAIMDNASDPFLPPNSQNANVGNALTTFGGGLGVNAISGQVYAGSTNCQTSDCLLAFDIEYLGGSRYRVSMTPDTTWASPQNTVSTAQITLKVPTGGFEVANLTSLLPGVQFDLTGRQNAPNEDPANDYLSFSLLTTGTLGIPFEQGTQTGLFEFDNSGTCPGGFVQLMPADDPFLPPNSQNANVGNQLTVFGWGAADAPVCAGLSAQTPCLPLPRDTVFLLLTEISDTFCIETALQLPGGVGQGSSCMQGNSVNAVFSGGVSACFQLNAGGVFSGSDTLCVSHCLGGVCDTTILVVTLQIAPPCGVVLDTFFLQTPTACGLANGSLTLSGSGAPNLLFCVGGLCQNLPFFGGLAAGTYIVKIKNAADTTCVSAEKTIVLLNPPAPEILQVMVENPSTCTSSDGALHISAAPTPGLQFCVNGQCQNDSNFWGLAAGAYTIYIYVADSLLCASPLENANLTGPPPPQILGVAATAPSGCDLSDGYIAVQALQTGNVPGDSLLFSINGGAVWQTDSLFENLPMEVYSVWVKNGRTECTAIWANNPLALTACGQTDTLNLTMTDPDGNIGFCAEGMTFASWDFCEMPQSGNVVALPFGCFSYEPDSAFSGTEHFCLLLCTASGLCDTLLVNILVPTAPAISNAVDDSLMVAFGGNAELMFLINDILQGLFVVKIVTPPQFGSIEELPGLRFYYQFTPNTVCNDGLIDIFQYALCNPGGCDTATVYVYANCDGAEIQVYEGFSPNGDNVNDFFKIRGIEYAPGNRVQVFNRWGARVFSAENYQNNWAGDWQGRVLPAGVYFWILDLPDGERRSGAVGIRP